MSKLRCHISISLDGFVAGPNQSEENPLGEGGERLHDWVVPLAAWRQSHDKQDGEVNESTRVFEESVENIGAAVMGRNMFGPIGGGAWGEEQWTGWWGDDPPSHYPVSSSPITRASPWKSREAPPSTSSPTESSPHSCKQGRRPAAKTSASGRRQRRRAVFRCRSGGRT